VEKRGEKNFEESDKAKGGGREFKLKLVNAEEGRHRGRIKWL